MMFLSLNSKRTSATSGEETVYLFVVFEFIPQNDHAKINKELHKTVNKPIFFTNNIKGWTELRVPVLLKFFIDIAIYMKHCSKSYKTIEDK
jgi:hypothetical protein